MLLVENSTAFYFSMSYLPFRPLVRSSTVR